jgi:hypothetical protein
MDIQSTESALPVMLQLGVGGIFAVMILDRTLNFIKFWSNGSKVSSSNGSRFVDDTLRRLSETMVRQTAIMEAQTKTLERIERRLEAVE